MSNREEGMSCEVVEMVKRSVVRWSGHFERISESAFYSFSYISEGSVQ